MPERKRKDMLIKPPCRSHGGVHPPQNKHTAEIPTARIPLPDTVYIPLRQHIGSAAEPLVKAGDAVFVGSKIGDGNTPLCVPVHSSVSGTVKELTTLIDYAGNPVQTVVITPDGEQNDQPGLQPVTVNTADELIAAARESGLVGLGGAGFPTYIKLKPNEKAPIDTIIINAAECEPYITSDYRALVEDGDVILQGIHTLLRTLNPSRIILAIEDNKPLAIDLLVQKALQTPALDERIQIMQLPTRYPHGAEKILVQVVTGRRIAMGQLPASVGCAVLNVTGLIVLQHYLNTGMPLTRRRITVDGPAVKAPKNFWVPVGTPIAHLLNQVELHAEPAKILMGGPMMGIAQCEINAPVLKQNNAILVFNKKSDLSDRHQTACIRCGRCTTACPMNLMPTLIERFAKIGDLVNLKRVGVGVCMECGSCAFNCPAHRPLVQYMRLAKEIDRKGRTE